MNLNLINWLPPALAIAFVAYVLWRAWITLRNS